MMDASLAESLRERLVRQTGNTALAQRVVPRSLAEDSYLATARELSSVVEARTGRPAFPVLDLTGPLGLPNPASVAASVQALRDSVTETYPKLRGLASHPNAQAMVTDLTTEMLQRIAARSVRLVFSDRDAEAQQAQQAQQALAAGRRL